MRAMSLATPAVALVAAALFVGTGCADRAVDERTPRPQQTDERVVAEGDFEIVDTLAADGPSFAPALVTVLAGGDVLVYDAGSYRMLRYDSTGTVVARYGAGRGTDPGQHERVADIGEFDSGLVWSFDQQAGAVNIFRAGGDLDGRLQLEEPVHFLTAENEERLVGINPAVDPPFIAFGAGGEVTDAFGWLLDDPGMDSVPYVGRIMPLEGGGFVYLMQSADVLKAWDASGDLLWHRMMIDGFEPPGVYTEQGDSAWLQHPNGRSTITRMPLGTSNGRIHVFAVNSTADIAFIDTYDARDGSYVGSRRVPVTVNRCAPAYVKDATAWLICGGGAGPNAMAGPMLVRARIPAL